MNLFGLLSLAFTLSLDNFRSSLVLGGLKPTILTSVKTSAIFGAWDCAAPAVGILIGRFLSDKIGSTSDKVAMVALGVYGAFLIIRALISPERADPDLRWARRGLPLPLSVDNVVAGTTLGLAGYSPWLAPIVCAAVTFGMSVVGHQIGRTVAHFFDFVPRMNTDLLVGIGFATIAALMALGVTLPLSGG